MNYTTAVFLINNNVRAIQATYEAGDSAVRTTFKTLDPSIKPDDLIIVPTDTRHKMTVCKVMEVDVELDLDTSTPVAWVIGKVNSAPYNLVLEQEQQAISAIKSAELRRKRAELSKAMFADNEDAIRALPIAASAAIADKSPA